MFYGIIDASESREMRQNLASEGELQMYKRHSSQMSLFDEPEMFGKLPLDPNNEWVKLGKIIPWAEFEYRYEE